jgi:hypothetical protein
VSRAAALAVAVALAVTLGGCDAPRPRELMRASDDEVLVPPAASTAMRPGTTWLMQPIPPSFERCEVLRVDEDGGREAVSEAPCPHDLRPGERVRIVGKTCLREGAPARERPFVCPDPLTNAERDALLRAHPGSSP